VTSVAEWDRCIVRYSTTAATLSTTSLFPHAPSITTAVSTFSVFSAIPSITTVATVSFAEGVGFVSLTGLERFRVTDPAWDAPTKKSWWRNQVKRDRQAILARRRAAKKAELLLARFLTKGQRGAWVTKKAFDVEGLDGELYRIRRGTSFNVDRLDRSTGKVTRTFCANLGAGIPEADVVLAQKMMLEAAPDEFFAKANAR
jgi:hypothetical protein